MTRKGDRTSRLHGLAAPARAVPALLAALTLVLIPAAALARPGGGQGYSGGGGSGGGGGDGAGVIFLLLRLWIQFVIAYPQLGVPLTIIIAVVFVQRQRRQQREGAQHWDSRPAAGPPAGPASHDLDQRPPTPPSPPASG